MRPLTVFEKLGYGVADIGASLSYNTVNIFLLFFLVEVSGLNPGLAGAVVLIGRMFDAVTDPLMGSLFDRYKARYGYKRFIRIGALPFGLTFALIWVLPRASQAEMFVTASLLLSLHMVAYTFTQVPYMALTPRLAPTYEARTDLSGYRIGFGTLASLFAAALPLLLVALFNDLRGLPEHASWGWWLMGLAFGLVMTLSYAAMTRLVPEPPADHESDKASFLESTRAAWSVYGLKALMGLFMVLTLGLGLVSSILPFFLASLQLGTSQQTLVLGLLFLTGILSLPLWIRLAQRLGKPGSLALGLGLLSSSLLVLVFASPAGGLSAQLLGSSVLAGVGLGALLLFPWAMLPDLTEYSALATGAHREGILYALFTFGQKVAFALGAFLNGQALNSIGYEPGILTQSDRAVTGIRTMVGPVAALVFALALIVALRYPIRPGDHEKVRTKLTGRA